MPLVGNISAQSQKNKTKKNNQSALCLREKHTPWYFAFVNTVFLSHA